MILTSKSKKHANQNIRTINYRLSIDLNESNNRYICLDCSTNIITTISTIKDINQIVKFTNSANEFIRQSLNTHVAEKGIIMTSKQISELKIKHNPELLKPLIL